MKHESRVSRISTTLLLCTTLLIEAPGAQQPVSSKVRRCDRPLGVAHLDLSTGTVTRGSRSRPKTVTTVSTFSNLDLAGFVGVDTGSSACEWIDAGLKNGGQTGFVKSWVFAYCSAALDVKSGGTGGAAEWFFIEGYTTGGLPGTSCNVGFCESQPGGVPSGTEIARFTLTGLPANTADSSFFGGFTCTFLTVDLGDQPFCFADGPIGYGWRFTDLGSDGVLAATFPFLSCVQSCSGEGPDGQGMVSCIDQYCPPGFQLVSGCPAVPVPPLTYASISLELREVQPVLPSSSIANGSGVNPLSLAAQQPPLGAGASIGAPWDVSLDCTDQSAGGLGLVRVTVFGKLALPLVLLQGELLIQGREQDFVFGDHGGATVQTPTVVLPKNLSFLGLEFQVQGFCGDAGPGGGALSNALCVTIGT